MKDSMIFNSLKNGTIRPHYFGGIDIDFKTGAVVNAKGEASDNIFAVGSLTRGVYFYTNSLSQNIKHGKKVIKILLEKIKKTETIERV